MPGGRPLKYNNCLDVDALCELYFESCIYETDEWGDILPEYTERKTPIPFTITGLALALGTNRQTLMEYQKRDEFADTIKKAKSICENYAENQLFTNKTVSGVIFNMKNNYNWVDKTEVDQNTKLTLEDYTDDEIDAQIVAEKEKLEKS